MAYQASEKSTVENPCVRFAQGLRIPVLKVNPLWSAGWPDRIFFIPGGRPLFIEFKRPGGKTSPKQDQVIATLRSIGYDVEVVDNVEQGKEAIRSRLAAHSVHEKVDEVDSGTSGVRTVPRSRTPKD